VRVAEVAPPWISVPPEAELLRRGRAFVFPIRWEEPFGLVMIEALACGMPVVATPRGAATEIVDDGVTGFLRPDLDSLAAALRDLERISPYDCRARVARYFSAEAMVDGHEGRQQRFRRMRQWPLS
jgi:glycosyltransferase involved in cell wall biosynthesis